MKEEPTNLQSFLELSLWDFLLYIKIKFLYNAWISKLFLTFMDESHTINSILGLWLFEDQTTTVVFPSESDEGGG